MSGELSTHTIIPDDKSDLQEEHATLVEKEIQFLRVKVMETAMGTKMAVAFANIFMAKIEKEILRQSTGSPESQLSQQHSGSQIIRICMEIYLKIDKTVKMYKNSY